MEDQIKSNRIYCVLCQWIYIYIYVCGSKKDTEKMLNEWKIDIKEMDMLSCCEDGFIVWEFQRFKGWVAPTEKKCQFNWL